jgi:hypothetical protein
MTLTHAAGAEILAGGASNLDAGALQDAWDLGLELLARHERG